MKAQTNQPKVSIIIPVIAINDYIRESIPKILELDYSNYEILIFPDEKDTTHHWPKTTIIPSGKVGPAEKRDMSIKYATGEILAFLDDDAYPMKDWLKKAVRHFKDKTIAGVGGPAITPNDDGILQKVSGGVYESILGGGKARNRYLPVGKEGYCNDWPTVNLLVRKDIFEQIGGFDNTYWPGEDTKLCLDIILANYKIKYDPKAIVYHHRRSDLWKHLKQTGNYAMHRGHFVKIYPETSRSFFYFVPSIFDLYLVVLLVLLFTVHSLIFYIALIPLAAYGIGLLASAVELTWRWKSPLIGIITLPMIFLTHVWYGIRFVWGLSLRKLEK